MSAGRVDGVVLASPDGPPSSSGLTHPDEAGPGVVARLLLALLALYRATARLRTPRCRFLPTCSTFAVESVELHGAGRGTWLAVRRIARCHPWNPGGLDPVPSRRPSTRK